MVSFTDFPCSRNLAWLRRKPHSCPLKVELHQCGQDVGPNSLMVQFHENQKSYTRAESALWCKVISLEARLLEIGSYFNSKQTICFGLYTEHDNLTAIGTSYIKGDFIFVSCAVWFICVWFAGSYMILQTSFYVMEWAPVPFKILKDYRAGVGTFVHFAMS